MKRMNLLLAGSVALCALLLTGCGGEEKLELPTPTAPIVYIDPSPTPTPEVKVPAKIEIKFSTEAEIVDNAGYEHFTEEQYRNNEFLKYITISTDQTITNVQFKQVGVAEVGTANMMFNEGAVLYTALELSPSKSLVIGTVFDGESPTRAISYTDATGETVKMYVAQSVRDGTLVFEQYE